MQKIHKLIKRAQKEAEDACSHKQGGSPLSDTEGELTSIVWHQLDRNGDTIGICTGCLKQFFPKDKDYDIWRKMRSGNIMSRGGQYGEATVSGFTLERSAQTLEETGLDGKSDQEINDLFERAKEVFSEKRDLIAVEAALFPKPIWERIKTWVYANVL